MNKQNVSLLLLHSAIVLVAVICAVRQNVEATIGWFALACAIVCFQALLEQFYIMEELTKEANDDCKKSLDITNKLIESIENAGIYTGEDKK